MAILATFILAILAWYTYENSQKTSTITDMDATFAVKDTASIDKIYIVDKQGSNVTLERKENGWMVNNKLLADPMQINLILETLHSVQVRRPVTKGEREEVVKSMAGEHQKVEVYRGNRLLKSFYVGGTTNDAEGTYYLLDGAETPYVVHLRYFRGILNTRFAFRENAFRSRGIFTYDPTEIEQIKVTYNKLPADSNFTITGKGNYFQVNEVSNVDTNRLVNYVQNFAKVFYTELAKETFVMSSVDSTLQQLGKYATIEITASDKARSQTLDVYLGSHEEDKYEVCVMHNPSDTVRVYRPTLQKLLQNRDYFKRRGV